MSLSFHSMAPNSASTENNTVEIRYDVKKLPPWDQLNSKIRRIEESSSWMDRYGWDWIHIITACALVPGCLRMLAPGEDKTWFQYATATFLLGCYHCTLANKAGHISVHGALCQSKTMSKFWMHFFVEFIGSYSVFAGVDSHVKMHHPHTNIIGLGDSSIWKVPQLSRIPYMIFMPLLVPIITPLIAVQHLIELKAWKELPKFFLIAGSGLALHVYVLVKCSEFTVLGAIAYLFTYRAVMSISYIHINIFQHIGLPMFSPEHRPARIYQMSSGVLNLHSNLLLNVTMGHSLVSCHVQHHLFPRLSDNMCKKVEPVVKEYLQKNGLPYHEDSYFNRFFIFLRDYDTLMVNAPPITHFVGIQ